MPRRSYAAVNASKTADRRGRLVPESVHGDGAAARRHRKIMLLDDTQLREWNGRKHAVMRDAMHAKFSQHETLRTVLLATVVSHPCGSSTWSRSGTHCAGNRRRRN
jgi:predicted NAD-dependent protein-ADP-ribosyltransferase YbiA (DUF1768 family)